MLNLRHSGRAMRSQPSSFAARWPRPSGDSVLFLCVTAIVLASRLPFLGPGYGLQPDAWRVALAAHHIANTGEYWVSRFPGNPVHELTSALLWAGGPWALNGMTALFSGIASAFFALSLKALRYPDAILASLALACIPVVYIFSTMSLDSVWALAFILGALYLVILRRPVLAGLSLGLSIGCRITSGAMLLPLAVLLLQRQSRREALVNIARLCVATGVIGAAAFAPVLVTYGWSFFTFSETMGYPPWHDVFLQATTEVWGSLGVLGLLVALLFLVFKPPTLLAAHSRPTGDAGLQLIAWAVAIILYTVAFLRLPHQSKYLIPLLPFVLLLLNRLLERRVFVALCVVLIASPFVTVGRSGVHLGPIFSQQTARRDDMDFVERIILRANGLHQRAVVVVGAWLPKILGVLLDQPPGNVEYLYALTASDLQRHLAESAVYYLPDIREYNRALTGLDLADSRALPLPPSRTAVTN